MGQNSWRSVVGDRGFASWVRELHGRAGIFRIRNALSKRELKQGRSSDLYGALTRHFQRWRGSTRGPTFDRHRVEVLVELVTGAGHGTTDEAQRLAPCLAGAGLPHPIRASLTHLGGIPCPLAE